MTDTYVRSSFLQPDVAMPRLVGVLVGQFTNIWWECGDDLPDLGPISTLRQQRERAALFEQYLKNVTSAFEKMPPDGPARTAAARTIRDLSYALARSALGMKEQHLQAIQSYDFASVARQFAQMARQFDPAIGDADIFQASRNVISMNFMQVLLGLPVEMTPAIFAYSMLYPYTDNYLDDPAISGAVKRSFNERFYRRIAGELIRPANAHEQIICDLIEMIEGQFQRRRYPQVYDSLLAIHIAQSNSLNLLRTNASPYEVDVLGICFEKGGTSVLADGYLVNGELDEVQREFMFYYGTFTQLLDDLEDTRQDLNEGRMTIFSQTARHWPLDAVTNRTFHFAGRVLEALDALAAPGAEPLKELIRSNVTPLLIGEAGSLGQFYTRAYLRTLEPHSLFRFSFLQKQRRKLSRQRLSLIRLVEALAEPAS